MKIDLEENNLLLTGLPRSGSTLTCFLLNMYPDTIALHEPMKVGKFKYCESDLEILRKIENFFSKTRISLLTRGKAFSKNIKGKIPDNTYLPDLTFPGVIKRKKYDSRSEISFDKLLSENFNLIIKHNASFAAKIDCIRERYLTYAVVRNPLSILASWNSLNMNVTTGHIYAAENLDTKLFRSLKQIPDKYDRQFYILDWFYKKFQPLLLEKRVLYYEDTVMTNGNSLAKVINQDRNINFNLQNKNLSHYYDRYLTLRLGERILRENGSWEPFYSKESIEIIMEAIEKK